MTLLMHYLLCLSRRNHTLNMFLPKPINLLSELPVLIKLIENVVMQETDVNQCTHLHKLYSKSLPNEERKYCYCE